MTFRRRWTLLCVALAAFCVALAAPRLAELRNTRDHAPPSAASDRGGGGAPRWQARLPTTARAISQVAASATSHTQHLQSSAQGARIAELDEALAIEEANEARATQLDTAVRAVLKGDPAADNVRVDCGQTFCRIVIEKPLHMGMEWPAIDNALTSLIKGETIFQTERNGDRSTAFVYSSDADSHLPLAQLGGEAAEDEELAH